MITLQGGFSWAVLVAKVCIDYPNQSAPELVQTFFHVYREWRWPEPVALIDFQEVNVNSLKNVSSSMLLVIFALIQTQTYVKICPIHNCISDMFRKKLVITRVGTCLQFTASQRQLPGTQIKMCRRGIRWWNPHPWLCWCVPYRHCHFSLSELNWMLSITHFWLCFIYESDNKAALWLRLSFR